MKTPPTLFLEYESKKNGRSFFVSSFNASFVDYLKEKFPDAPAEKSHEVFKGLEKDERETNGVFILNGGIDSALNHLNTVLEFSLSDAIKEDRLKGIRKHNEEKRKNEILQGLDDSKEF